MPSPDSFVSPVHHDLDMQLGAKTLAAIGQGNEHGYRLFHAATDEHMVSISFPGDLPQEEIETRLESYKQRLAANLGTVAGFAHISIEPEEARDLL